MQNVQQFIVCYIDKNETKHTIIYPRLRDALSMCRQLVAKGLKPKLSKRRITYRDPIIANVTL